MCHTTVWQQIEHNRLASYYSPERLRWQTSQAFISGFWLNPISHTECSRRCRPNSYIDALLNAHCFALRCFLHVLILSGWKKIPPRHHFLSPQGFLIRNLRHLVCLWTPLRKRGLCFRQVSVCLFVTLVHCIHTAEDISSNFFVGPVARHSSFLTPSAGTHSNRNAFSSAWAQKNTGLGKFWKHWKQHEIGPCLLW